MWTAEMRCVPFYQLDSIRKCSHDMSHNHRESVFAQLSTAGLLTVHTNCFFQDEATKIQGNITVLQYMALLYALLVIAVLVKRQLRKQPNSTLHMPRNISGTGACLSVP